MNSARRMLKGISIMLAAALLVGTAVGAVALRALQPATDEWAMTVRTGPWSQRLSMPVMLRWATHPLVLPLLDQRTLSTRAGRWQLRTTREGAVKATCSPCLVHVPALGSGAVRLNAVQVDIQRDGPNTWRGLMTVGDGHDPLRLTWQAQLLREGLKLQGELARTPIAAVLNAFGDAIPEMRHARVQGDVAVRAQGVIDASGLREWRLTPALSHVDVDGLGTETLRWAQPAAGSGCARAAHSSEHLSEPLSEPSSKPLQGWLPRAVIAAEDQRFHQHPGYDLDEWLASWTRHARGGPRPRGASTLTQQLAKLVYVGDERSPTRKLREWLYAVEMERTLGKARILQLYLALAPWGAGTCGASAAALQHLGKPAARLTLQEAAWLASLLAHPDTRIRSVRTHVDEHRTRASRVVEAIRPLSRERREAAVAQLQHWTPPSARSRQNATGPHHRDTVNMPSL